MGDTKLIVPHNPPSVSNKIYRKHISSILKESTNFDHSNIERWTDDKYSEKWEISRTHATIDLKNSYETMEFFGDKLANSVVSLYVSQEFPHVKNTGWLTKIDNHMHSKKGFSHHAVLMGLYKYIKISDKAWFDCTHLPDKYTNDPGFSVWDNPNWEKLLTDLFEALVGTLFNVVLDDQSSMGVAYEVISAFCMYYFKRASFKLESLNDPISLLKESMDEKRQSLGLRDNKDNPAYRFITTMVLETRPSGTKSADGKDLVEHRYIFKFPDPNVDPAVNLRKDNMHPRLKKYEIGDWMPDASAAKTAAAFKGLELWKDMGFKIKKKASPEDKTEWKPKEFH